jgi:hypothetical protein
LKKSALNTVLLCAQLVAVSACVGFKSMHENFIESMDAKVATKKTVEQHGYDPKYAHGFFLADEHYLTSKERRQDGTWVYHFALPMLNGRITCHYYLLVDQGSRIVVGYGFDREFGDPERTCRIAA